MNMTRWIAPVTAGLFGTAALMLVPSVAHAGKGFAACGDIHVEADAQCTIEAEGGCDVKCTPLSCSAALYAQCEGECTGSANVDCEGQCDIKNCKLECEGGEFDCSAHCQGECDANCSADCEGQCESSDNSAECQGECEASCEATCQGECDASCDIEKPDCDAECQASCEGQCTAEANLKCQVNCQSKGYAECEGGCKAKCTRPEGAMFCDGEFVDDGGNLRECYDALKGWVKSHIDVKASSEFDAQASCDNGRCTADAKGSAKAEAKASCAATPGGPASGTGLLVGLFLGAGALLGRRRAKP
jgi:MYXO-CTERM domain-containing protein